MGCKYCDGAKDYDERALIDEELSFEPLGTIWLGCRVQQENDVNYINVINTYDKTGPRLKITLNFHDDSELVYVKKIRFCPMCGRKLVDE